MLNVTTSEAASIAFDYSALDRPLADDLRATALRVRSRLDDTKAAVFAIGRELLGVKDRLPHGKFGAWLSAEFDMSDSSARNYMRVAQHFGDKSATVAVLGARAVYALAAPSTPEVVRAAVIERVAVGERVPEAEIRDLVRDAKAKAIEEARRAKMTPRQRRTQAERASSSRVVKALKDLMSATTGRPA